ncbi:MAG: HAMP domain-containing protein [Planctomycetes bacterium]|nr:HAMP domain-containing protein [Planctomycetota bacterium]MCP4771706.1 HAMP domain-containing protein [Planctomycetota bacterium]MCP4859994.1 HAMP domain-containing protein [Planctomycetota bacterium]
MNFSSLGSRLFLGSAMLVLLTLLLGAHFSGKAVRENFADYSQGEAEEQAYELAIYLEAWLNISDLTQEPGPALQRLFSGEVEMLSGQLEQAQGEDPAESMWEQWDVIAASNPGMDGMQLAGLIMEAEAARLRQEPDLSPADQVDWLASTLFVVHEYLMWHEDGDPDPEQEAEPFPERLQWFLETVVEDAQIWATDPLGRTIFDSSHADLGAALNEDLLESGSTIHSWKSGKEIATIVVAAGEGHYRGLATNFLQSVREALLQGAALTFVIALLLAWWFARRLLAPVRALTTASQEMARGEASEALPVKSNDEVGRMSTAFNDMRNALEGQHEQRRQMVADLAHEINTPLSVIQLELAGLKAGMQAPEDCAQQIEQELKVLNRLAADVALLAGADRGALTLDRQPQDLSPICQQAASRWQSRAQAAGISLSYKGADQLPPVHADALRISQVLGNLIANAIRHTPSGGKIEVNAQASASPAVESNSTAAVMLSVSDSGEGIAAKDLTKVFERFTRLDSSRGRQSGGSGLGLAIVADIVERHGGKVWAESSAGQGCAIRLTLPHEDNQSTTRKPSSES